MRRLGFKPRSASFARADPGNGGTHLREWFHHALHERPGANPLFKEKFRLLRSGK